MKTILALAALVCLAGCTTQRPPPPGPMAPVGPVSVGAVPGSSAALLFDPPLTQVSPPLNLDRTGRGEAAFVGFEQTTTSTYDVSTFNNVSTDGCDTYDRAACVDRVGTLTR